MKIAVACSSTLAKNNMSGLEKGVEVIPRSKSSQPLQPPFTLLIVTHVGGDGASSDLEVGHDFNEANGLTCSRRLGDAREEVKMCRMSLFSL